MSPSDKILIGIAKYMIEFHATQCDDLECWCRGSVFNDNLAELKRVDASYENLVNQIFKRAS